MRIMGCTPGVTPCLRRYAKELSGDPPRMIRGLTEMRLRNVLGEPAAERLALMRGRESTSMTRFGRATGRE
jgi:hypothetical protein